MKKFTKRLLAFTLAFAMLFSMCSNAMAETDTNYSEEVNTSGVMKQNIDSVLAEAEPIPAAEKNGEIRRDILLESNDVSEISTAVLDIETQSELQSLGVPIDEVKKADIMQDVLNYTDKTYTKYIIDHDHYVCVDENNKIQTIYNAGEDILAPTRDYKFNTTEKQYLAVGEQALEMLGLDGQYQLVKSEEESIDFWLLAYRKVLENGLENECDGVNIMISRANNTVGFLVTFNMPANTLYADITENEAIAAAQPIINKWNMNFNSIKLKYVQPNYFWNDDIQYEPANFVRLAYEIELNNSAYFIHVDAVTGEVIGGDMAMGAGGAFGDQYVAGATTRINLAKTGIGTTMGYTPLFYRCSSEYATKTDIMNYLQRSDARAFYFTGHGSRSAISTKTKDDKLSWSLKRETIEGYNPNCNFVMLACCSAGTPEWANTFNIYYNSTNKAFIGFYNTIWTSIDQRFNNIFWQEVGKSRLYNCALYAKACITDYNTPLYFLGDVDYWGGIL